MSGSEYDEFNVKVTIIETANPNTAMIVYRRDSPWKILSNMTRDPIKTKPLLIKKG